jgi:hypothetical protein
MKVQYTIYLKKIAGSNAKSTGTPDSKFIKRQTNIIAGRIPAATSTPTVKDTQLTADSEHRRQRGKT